MLLIFLLWLLLLISLVCCFNTDRSLMLTDNNVVIISNRIYDLYMSFNRYCRWEMCILTSQGSKLVVPNEVICTIETTDGETYPIKCNCLGNLIEINTTLITNPQLVSDHPETNGFIGIILPKQKRKAKDQWEDWTLFQDFENARGVKRPRSDQDANETTVDNPLKKRIVEDEDKI
eukprot:TRINITY_DN571_c0_g1_i1.p1 TRINITY_DN571_c0_g1~~TRINITY_DN571_c0_g1_i1.p1  ORF type:complete len:176 (+),score=25.17 TRINITY_DN571_c0_g1_i1:647-1174(+)